MEKAVPKKLQELEDEVGPIEERLRKLKDFIPKYDTMKRLTNIEIPRLEEEIKAQQITINTQADKSKEVRSV